MRPHSTALFTRTTRLIAGVLLCVTCLSSFSAPAGTPSLNLEQAIVLTLAQDAYIQLGREQTEFARGVTQSASGQFDAALDTGIEQSVAHVPRSQLDFVQSPPQYNDEPELITQDTLARLRVRKQFRSGITVSPGVNVTRYRDNLEQDNAVNRANVSFLIRFPLMRGRGVESTGAAEKAAKIEEQAAHLNLQQVIAQRILNTTTAFWWSLAAQQQVDVLRSSEAQSSNLVTAVSDVVKIDEVAPSELRQAEADLAARTAARIAGEQTYWAARQQLARSIGMPVEEMPSPPVPVGPFPEATVPKSLGPNNAAMLTQSLERRADYLAGIRLREASEVLERAATRDLQPRLDLDLEVGYAALEEGNRLNDFYGSLHPGLAAGPNALGRLSLEWPFLNRSARGLLTQRQASRRQSEIQLQELARSIYAGILTAREELLAARGELEQSEIAADKFRVATASEMQKVQLGTASILDVITLTDRLNNAQITTISARARYLIALARLRYETGWLLAQSQSADQSVSLEDLTTLPNWND
ncbi:MAG: hypothetical protein RI897_1229 [Verrucomicrobiota bacterium]|jgi:outer membrane protein TolC